MLRHLTVLTLAAALAACAPEAPGNNTDMEGLTQVDWTAETINGKPVIEPGKVTMTFLEGRVSGRSGCNQYSGSAEYGRSKLKVGPLISTKMACMANGVMQQESEFLATLQNATTYAFRSDDSLIVSTPTGGALVFDSTPRQNRPE
jgi:heat shock protein HslJ